MACVLVGRLRWEGERNDDGHRTYSITHRVRSAATDGPFNVMNCPGLPAVGASWNFSGDVDAWAFCYPTRRVAKHPVEKEGPQKFWLVTDKFSTIPFRRCQTTTIQDPLSEPQKLSGTFIKYLELGERDKDGNLICNTAYEKFQGKLNEWDANRPAVRIEQNVGSLGIEVFSAMVDNVNDSTLWGLPPRCVKLSNVAWQRNIRDVCTYYFTRIFDFDIDYNTFDRRIQNEGTKVLHGHWTDTGWVNDNINGAAPVKTNPQHYDRYLDRPGNPARVILDPSTGNPWDGTGTGSVPTKLVQKYTEVNLLLLGIPSSLT